MTQQPPPSECCVASLPQNKTAWLGHVHTSHCAAAVCDDGMGRSLFSGHRAIGASKRPPPTTTTMKKKTPKRDLLSW